MGHKRDADNNPIGRAHANPILDTCRYDVESDDGQVTEVTANIIAESMYSQCNPDGNQYVLVNATVDFCKNNMALSIEDQKIVVKGRPSLQRRTVV